MSQNVIGKKERVKFDGEWWWRPMREGQPKITMAIKSAGVLRVVRGGKFEKWLPAEEDKGK